MNTNNIPTIDYTNKDYESLRRAMLELAAEKLPEWSDHSDNDLGVVLLELFAYMGDILFYYQDRIANESYLHSAVERRSIINMLRLIGYELRPPTPASADLCLLFNKDSTETVRIEPGTAFQTIAEESTEPIGFQYVREPLSIKIEDLPVKANEDDGNDYRWFETLPVVQVDAKISAEIIGSSDYSPGQRMALAQIPLLAGGPLFDELLHINVDSGDGPETWLRRESLLHSRGIDQHYIVRRDENNVAWIEFGDGKYGAIPSRGNNNITANYRVGGGSKGNVPARNIIKKVSDVTDLEHVFNRLAATGGADAQASSEAVKHGPQLFRAMDRAVTAQDYEIFAKEFGVGKARARAPAWNRIEIYVAPIGGGYPTDTLKEDLRAYLEDKRMMSSIVDIRDPVYVKVTLQGTLEIEAYSFTEQVQQEVSNAIIRLLAFDNVDFEDRLFLSKVYEAIEAVKGVVGVHVSHFAPLYSVHSLPGDGVLRFGWNEIPVTNPVKWQWDETSHRWNWWTSC